jgi:hypothetical protein
MNPKMRPNYFHDSIPEDKFPAGLSHQLLIRNKPPVELCISANLQPHAAIRQSPSPNSPPANHSPHAILINTLADSLLPSFLLVDFLVIRAFPRCDKLLDAAHDGRSASPDGAAATVSLVIGWKSVVMQHCSVSYFSVDLDGHLPESLASTGTVDECSMLLLEFG